MKIPADETADGTHGVRRSHARDLGIGVAIRDQCPESMPAGNAADRIGRLVGCDAALESGAVDDAGDVVADEAADEIAALPVRRNRRLRHANVRDRPAIIGSGKRTDRRGRSSRRFVDGERVEREIRNTAAIHPEQADVLTVAIDRQAGNRVAQPVEYAFECVGATETAELRTLAVDRVTQHVAAVHVAVDTAQPREIVDHAIPFAVRRERRIAARQRDHRIVVRQRMATARI
ncbi:hypothetical protein, partial [Burkholderia pyrrocinia]|uniref:hypothetical protein n=1 Tax=Burkholderia pyrrocinia TaxID=60550 RepID=UPI001FC8C5D8